MKLHAYKFQGAGNDFVIIDNPDGNISLTEAQIRTLCDRRFGIGADGLMTVSPSADADFSMRYYNSDGLESLMCGNGGRCISAFFAKKKAADGAKGLHLEFDAADGRHCSDILEAPEAIEDISTIHPSAVRPKNGAMRAMISTNRIARYGVLYLLWSSPNQTGRTFSLAMEYRSLLVAM